MASPRRPQPTEEEVKGQFRLRAPTFESSAAWIADPGLLKAHVDLCRTPPTGVLLDVCCGTGIVGGSFRGRLSRLVGVDLTDAMRARAKMKLDQVHEGSAEKLPFPDSSFDVAVLREALHFLDAPRVLAEIFRVLKPGGEAIVSHIVPYGEADADWMRIIFLLKQPMARHFFLDRDIRGFLEHARFGPIESRDYLLWESIDKWIDTHETNAEARKQITSLYREIPTGAARIHPTRIEPSGEIMDQWRWVIFRAEKPRGRA